MRCPARFIAATALAAVSRVIRGRVRSEVEEGTRAALNATKTRLESKGMRP